MNKKEVSLEEKLANMPEGMKLPAILAKALPVGTIIKMIEQSIEDWKKDKASVKDIGMVCGILIIHLAEQQLKEENSEDQVLDMIDKAVKEELDKDNLSSSIL